MEIQCNHCSSIFYITEWPEDDEQICYCCDKLVDRVYRIDGPTVEKWVRDRAVKINEESLELPNEWLKQRPINTTFRIVGAILATPIFLVAFLFAYFLFGFIDPNASRRQVFDLSELWRWALFRKPYCEKMILCSLKAMKSSRDSENELIFKAICQGLSRTEMKHISIVNGPENKVALRLKKLRTLVGVSVELREMLEDITFALLWARQAFIIGEEGNLKVRRLDILSKLVDIVVDRESLIDFAKIMVQMSPLNKRTHPFLETLAKKAEDKAPKFAATLRIPKSELLT
ncbi:MAG: hypothetical protein PVJ60_04810 [Phycisphaerales bacterium]